MEYDLAKDGWGLDPDDGFVGHVGGLWRRTFDGETTFAFVAQEMHTNRNGLVHGGMLMTFIDRAFGQTARLATGAVRSATVNLNHQFLAPVRIGDLVEITPQLVKATSRLVFMAGTACVAGDPVLTAQGVWRVTHTAD
ncbi:PaaI family thioesterase [Notoacmeibacter sp. MSK16QG-6]|uniref:PaaI family thioesterase n=1 Tax=Notoacmeibacter sp. MSK16QG-6 TaxID=2957982 RepID=UPI00209DE142|nr:PaaI family thioesterase [Notoacmeibacter sp. MSK16QG-6]MCP1200573.1 PaaI family thioesterase [Notoacmeibacter sp. MSK16QG-6]